MVDTITTGFSHVVHTLSYTRCTLLLLIGFPVLWLMSIFINRICQEALISIRRPKDCKSAVAYPTKDPFFGLDMMIRLYKNAKEKTLLDDITARFEEAKPGCNTYSTIFLKQRALWTQEPEVIKTILSTNFKDYSLPDLRKKVLSRDFGEGIFSADGLAWEHSRAMVRPGFKKSEFGDLSFLEGHFQNLLDRIPANGETVDLHILFPLLTLDSASELLLGESTESLKGVSDDEAAKFADAFNYVGERLAANMRNPLSGYLPDPKKKQGVRVIHKFIDRYVDAALALRKARGKEEVEEEEEEEETQPGKKYNFLHELAKTDYPAEKIRIELLSILVAGRDTTASLLSIMWWILARRPDVVRKLQEEVAGLNGLPPTLEQVKNLKYLKWVMNEVLRLHPIAPLNSRTANKDTILPVGGGQDGKSPLFVPAGQRVLYSIGSLHRRKDIYGEDANDFRPERWDSLRPGWSYIPFSGGPRICIGQQLALNEAGYTTVRLLQEFSRVEPRGDLEWEENLTLILTVGKGCKVGLYREKGEAQAHI